MLALVFALVTAAQQPSPEAVVGRFLTAYVKDWETPLIEGTNRRELEALLTPRLHVSAPVDAAGTSTDAGSAQQTSLACPLTPVVRPLTL